MRFFNKRAQSTAEYAIVIALVLGAAIAMQVYVRRGFQRGFKFATDNLQDVKGFEKNPFTDKKTGQYEPYYLESETNTKRTNIYSTEETKAGGEVQRALGKAGAEEETDRAYKQEMRDTTKKD